MHTTIYVLYCLLHHFVCFGDLVVWPFDFIHYGCYKTFRHEIILPNIYGIVIMSIVINVMATFSFIYYTKLELKAKTEDGRLMLKKLCFFTCISNFGFFHLHINMPTYSPSIFESEISISRLLNFIRIPNRSLLLSEFIAMLGILQGNLVSFSHMLIKFNN